MRIISGIAGGRRLKTPEGRDVRPTSDKVRGAIFNSLRSRGAVEGAQVIDCFCGSGALGLEALSQGAAGCVFIDNNRKSLDLAKENAKTLGFEGRFIFSDAGKLKTRPEDAEAAGLVFLDPPYNKGLVLPALVALTQGGWIAKDAVAVIEAEKNFKDAIPADFKMLDEKLYGDTKVLFFRYSP
ncbi:MAG: 16S rRNA (guanine(966)-N(2))-methyltransferase RsmD [Alphaproteobacteria bacterium]|nr:16S rRNA (guanine(966)-N(2))-methyltransferase RsmD [Alphaproteobacteria bacterium]